MSANTALELEDVVFRYQEKGKRNILDHTSLSIPAGTLTVLMGGSGCGCSAAVLDGYLLRGMREGKWNRIIFAPTGALLSPTSTMQGESIPGVCHAVILENIGEES